MIIWGVQSTLQIVIQTCLYALISALQMEETQHKDREEQRASKSLQLTCGTAENWKHLKEQIIST